MEVGWCPEVTGSARVAHGQGAHRAAELAAATASLRRQQSKLLPRTQMPDSVTESTSGCIAGSDMPEAQPPMQHSSWLLWRKNDGVEQHAHRAARHERGRGRGAWPVRGAGNERRSVRKRTPLHGARERGRRRGAYDARRARVSSSRPSHVTKSVRTSSTLIFVLACGLRIVVRLGLVPLLRRKKAADGRARREPRRPTPGYLPSRDPAQTPHDTHSSCTVHVTECAHRYTGRWCQMGMGVGSASELLCTEREREDDEGERTACLLESSFSRDEKR